MCVAARGPGNQIECQVVPGDAVQTNTNPPAWPRRRHPWENLKSRRVWLVFSVSSRQWLNFSSFLKTEVRGRWVIPVDALKVLVAGVVVPGQIFIWHMKLTTWYLGPAVNQSEAGRGKQAHQQRGLFLLHDKRTRQTASIKSSLSSALGGWVDALYLRPGRPSPLSSTWLFKSLDYNTDVFLRALLRIIILNNIFFLPSHGVWLELSLHHQKRRNNALDSCAI